jgi:selenide,water dikinase
MEAFNLLPDPQTNGGLLISVSPEAVDAVKQVLTEAGLSNHTTPIGRMTAGAEKLIRVSL